MTPPAEPTGSITPEEAIADAIARWRREASDLGGRNPLLWYRDLYRGTFDLTVAHPTGVAKLLAGAPTLLSDLVRERVAFHEAKAKIRAIRDKAAQIQRDHGMSTAYITIGMASWTIRRAPAPPRAPVLLRPCRITPTDASHTDFTIAADPYLVVNPVLAHYLTSELGRRVDTERLVALARHEHGFDPRPAYTELEQICAGLDGFGIGPQMVISTFPWAKLPFVAALTEGEQKIAARPLPRLLALDPAPGDGPDHLAEIADGDLGPGDTVLDADRDQRAVVAAVQQGHSLVVDGPAGSGRTQTIANIVAERIGVGERVLVVSEFSPALQDLHLRLDDANLAHRAFWVKDNPRDLDGMVQALRSNLGDEPASVPSTTQARQRLERAERIIRSHHEAMHAPHEPWGVTLSRAEEVLARLAARPRPPVSHVRLTGQALRDLLPSGLENVCARLGTAAAAGAWQRGRGDDPWYGARLADEDETARAGEIVNRLVTGELDRARTLAVELCRTAGLPEPVTIDQWRRYLDLLGAAHETLDVFRSAIYEAPLDELAAAYDPEARPRPSARARGRAKRQVRSLLRPGTPPSDLGTRVLAAHEEWQLWEELAGRAARPTAVAGWDEAVEAFDPIESDLDWLAEVLQGTSTAQDLRTVHVDTLLERLLRLDARPDRLAQAAQSHALLQPWREVGLGPLVDDLASRGIQEDQVSAEVEFVYWTSLLDHFTATREPGNGADLRTAISDQAHAEAELRDALRVRIDATVAEAVPQALRRYAPQATYLRETNPGHDVPGWVGSITNLGQVLRPCWMISPIVLPALVPARAEFDLVIIDEATRIPTAHVITALTGAAQVVAFGSRLDPEPRTFTAAVEERAGSAERTPRESVWQTLAARLPVLSLGNDYRTIDERLRLPLRRAGIDAGHGFPGLLKSPRYALEWAEAEDLVDQVVDRVLDHARAAAWQSLAVVSPDPSLIGRIDHRLRERIAAEGMGRAFRDDAAEALLLSPVQDAAGLVRDRLFLVVENHHELDAKTVTTAVTMARRSVVTLLGGAQGTWPFGSGADILADALQAAHAGEITAPHGSQLLDDLTARLRGEMLTVRGPLGSGSHRIDLAIEDPEVPDRPLLAVRTDLRPWSAGLQTDGVETGEVEWDHLQVVPRHLARLGWATEEVWGHDLFRDPAREVARLVHAVRDVSAQRSGTDG